MEKQIYLVIKDGKILVHTNINAMLQLDGVDYETAPKKLQVSESEYARAGSTAYINDSGDIVLGRTAAEIAKIEARERVMAIQHTIEETEKKMARSQSAIVKANIDGTTPNSDDITFFSNYVNLIAELRTELVEKLAILDE
jgi:hypothetical protein